MRRLRIAISLPFTLLAALLAVPAVALARIAAWIAGVPLSGLSGVYARKRPGVLERQRVAPRTAKGTLPPMPDAWRPSDGGAS